MPPEKVSVIEAGGAFVGPTQNHILALARDLRVSVITTTRAYNELVADGLVVAVRGKGVFVRAPDGDQLRRRALEQIDEGFDLALRAARTAGIEDRDLTARLARHLDLARHLEEKP